nr:MAG TPA: hypothetical protein [Crassvirales sp.]
MSFIINQNFDLKSPQFNFARDYFADLAALKTACGGDWTKANYSSFPDHFITSVGGTLYQYTSSNSIDTNTGKWRKLILGSDVNLSGYATIAQLNNKVDKVTGKGLSTNDFTAAYKTKLDGIDTNANHTVVDDTLKSDSTNPVQNKVINGALSNKAAKSEAIKSIAIAFDSKKGTIASTLANNSKADVDIPLAVYDVLSDVEDTQKAGLVTGAERKAINMLSLSGSSVVNSGLQLTLGGVMGDNNAIVTIPFATSNMDNVSYGLIKGSDKKKLDSIAEGANKYSLPVANANALGGIRIGYSYVAGIQNYPILLDASNKAYVNVPWKNTEYSVATTSANGLMSSADKTKLDNIQSGANKTIVDTALSTTSTNPLQNRVISSSFNAMQDSIDGVKESVNAITAISKNEIDNLFT